MDKKVLTNAASVGIIYRASDPSQVFLEVKDAGYPRKIFVGMGCLIGGNWVGENAKNDAGPLETFIREVAEELSFENALADAVELKQLHDVTDLANLDLGRLRTTVTPTISDEEDLDLLVEEIAGNTLPYRAHIVAVPEALFRARELNYSRGDSVGLISYYTVGLSELMWSILTILQGKFGNISNESVTLMTSLDEMIENNFQISWGHDNALRQFFLDKGFGAKATRLPMVPGISVEHVGVPADNYDAYLERFEFKLNPRSG